MVDKLTYDCKNQMLYHYTSSSVAIQYILANNELRFGSFQNVNDPSESKKRRLKYVFDSNKSKYRGNENG